MVSARIILLHARQYGAKCLTNKTKALFNHGFTACRVCVAGLPAPQALPAAGPALAHGLRNFRRIFFFRISAE
jgi:hypothetical protein